MNDTSPPPSSLSNYYQVSSNFRRRSSSGNSNLASPRNATNQSTTDFSQQQYRNSLSLFLISPLVQTQSPPSTCNIPKIATQSCASPMFEMINSFTLTTVFSQMIIHGNSQNEMVEEMEMNGKLSVSTMNLSLVSNNDVKLPISVLELSHLHSLLLVVRKSLQDSTRKIIELVEWQKSLKQLGVLPVLVFQNSKMEGDEFLEGDQWNGYSIDVNNMLRVPDVNFELTKQLFHNAESPVLEQDETINVQLLERDSVESKMFLIRNGAIVWESSTKPEDQVVGTLLSTVVLKLPWYAMSTDEISSDESQHCAPPPLNTSTHSTNNQSYKSSSSLSSSGRGSIRMDHGVAIGGASSPSNSSISAGGVSSSLIRIGSLLNDHNSFIVPAGLSLHGAMNVLQTISSTSNNLLNGGSINIDQSENDNGEIDQFGHEQFNVHKQNENNFETFSQNRTNVSENRNDEQVIELEEEMNTPNRYPTQKEQSFISNNTTSSDKMTNHTSGTPLLGADSRYCSSTASMNSTFIETSASSLDLTTLMMPPSPSTLSTSPASAETLIQKRKLSIFRKFRGRGEIEKIAVEQQKLEHEMQLVKKREIANRSQTNIFTQNNTNKPSDSETHERRSIFSICFGSSRKQSSQPKEKTLVVYDPIESHLSEMYQVMHDDMKRQYFKLFSLKQFNAENLLFWEDVKLFYKKIVIELKRQYTNRQRFSLKSSQTDTNQSNILNEMNISKESVIELEDKIMKMAKYIAEKYLFEKDSVYCLNTSNKMIEQVRNRMSLQGLEFINVSENIFDDVVTEIIKTVLPDMFCRFVLSYEYDEMQRVLQTQVSNKLF